MLRNLCAALVLLFCVYPALADGPGKAPARVPGILVAQQEETEDPPDVDLETPIPDTPTPEGTEPAIRAPDSLAPASAGSPGSPTHAPASAGSPGSPTHAPASAGSPGSPTHAPASAGSPGSPTHASAPVRAPLAIDLNAAELDALSPERRAMVSQLEQLMEQQLYYWASFPIQLPPSAFEQQGRLIEVDNLFQAPTDSELETVARDPDGKLKKLTDAQRAQIRREALFVVPSQRYPGQNHIWKISVLLQKGGKKITANLQEAEAASLRRLIIKVPDRLVGEDAVSVRRGLSNILHGVRETVALLIGLVEKKAVYSDATITQMIQKESSRGRLELLKMASSRCFWTAPDGVRVDLRLYDPELLEHVRPTVDALFQATQRDWKLEAVAHRKALELALEKSGVPAADIPQAVAERLIDEQQERFYQSLLQDAQLETLSPGIGKRLVEHARAVRIVIEADQAQAIRLAARQAEITATLQQKHPVRFRISEWRERRIARTMSEFAVATRWDSANDALARLKAAGLAQEAWLLQQNVAFMQTRAEGLRSELRAQRLPSNHYTWSRRLWSSKNWKIEKLERADRGPDRFYYQATIHRNTTVTTGYPFWRLANFWFRTVTWANNGLYWLLVENAWNGSLGLKSLFKRDPFYAGLEVDPETGRIIPDQSTLTTTLSSRVGVLWDDVRQSRAEFEHAPDTGFIGKSFTRWINRGWNYVLKGGLGTVFIVVGQPVLTVANLGATGALTLTSVGWAPASSLLTMAFNVTLYDTENPRTRHSVGPLPLLDHTLIDIGITGAGQVALGLVDGLAIEPALSAVILAGGGLRGGVRTFYDALTYGLIIRPLARVPATDSFFARRIEGPGLSSAFYFQLRPELALLALQAWMEREELKLYKRNTEREIDAPVLEFNRFTSQVFGPFVQGTNGTKAAAGQLHDNTRLLHKALDEATRRREKQLTHVLEIQYAEHIRETREDLETTLNEGARLVRHFYTTRILARMMPGLGPDQVARFWAEKNLAHDDWMGLTRMLLASAFSGQILEPLEESDKTLRLVVEHIKLKGYFEAIEKGIGPGDDLKKVSLSRTAAPVEVQARTPLITPEKMFGGVRNELGESIEALDREGGELDFDAFLELKGLNRRP